MDLCDICLLILALFLPFISVLLADGCGFQFCLNIILCIFFWIPGASPLPATTRHPSSTHFDSSRFLHHEATTTYAPHCCTSLSLTMATNPRIRLCL